MLVSTINTYFNPSQALKDIIHITLHPHGKSSITSPVNSNVGGVGSADRQYVNSKHTPPDRRLFFYDVDDHLKTNEVDVKW